MTSFDWRGAGAALGPFDTITVLVLTGASPVALAAAARGAASAAPDDRRVAVFDLAGGFGTDDHDGIISAFRDGRSLNALARPLEDGNGERFIVPRGPGPLDTTLIADPRWQRLIDGFHSAGALLILLVASDFVGAGRLAKLGDRTVDLDTLSAPDPVLPPAQPPAVGEVRPRPSQLRFRLPSSTPMVAPPPRADPHTKSDATLPARGALARRVALVVIGAGLITGAWIWHPETPPAPDGPAARVTKQGDSLASLDASKPIAPDTLALPIIVNPQDSLHAAQWGVELVATNDRADANLRLAAKSALAARTMSPVLLGDDPAPWYKIVGGAFVDRTAAELMRRALRQVGEIEPDAGVVARVPLAFRLEASLPPDSAKAVARAFIARGIAAYALLQDDDHAAVYAGAFSSPQHSVLLLAELRSAGLAPDLAFRVGRTY